MLKFVQHNLETIAGVAIYPIISLLIFFFFFVGLYTWTFTYKKEKIDEMSNLPFSDEDNQN
ncbi:CcoQ/FixQ family Cbb3-type cytochrome c oxidase assembly chaperone [Flavobacterium subsaxonicum]|uniref:Cytochrome C oxidase subunit IV n=1 Tax=Flavobacterium subsaxonicum WB 4.1-42 = DSM 21790 TaxID=1121898 RepID=A0A0A2MTZ6_9FLAO|nr:CcoQ/FixQ family Cbb3-type cytochrome c oxidase assembly chaperone [Flavobacterium subsaxonicum]KGO94953.1 cytochrome C oxidase subunit IV [Flavobacterium subsaxonicum WB 4.1-42 = DSM 21790]